MITLFSTCHFWLAVLKMSIKTSRFFFLTFCCVITPISGIINHYCIMKNLKNKSEKKRTNSEQYTLKIMKILRAASLGSNFTGSYKT